MRFQGAYLGSAVAALVARECDFWCAIVDVEDSWYLELDVEVSFGGVIRRLFIIGSRSLDVLSGLEALFPSFEEREVVGLLPMPFKRALNFRFVAFIMPELLKYYVQSEV